MRLLKLIFYINAILFSFNTLAQENIPIGEWRVHLPYKVIRAVESAGNFIYAGAEINGYYVDNSDGSIQILSKVHELNDIEIREIKYNSNLNLLVLGYENGNIDIIKDNVTININDIERKSMVGSKRINHISFSGNFAYLSCDFGACVVNLAKYEVKETYSSLAPSGLSNKVFSSTFSSDGDSIFLATERGVMAAKNSPAVNLMDYNNWFTYGPANNLPATEAISICNFNSKIYCAINDSIYYLNGSSWVKSKTSVNVLPIRTLNVSKGKLLACSGNQIIIADNDSVSSIVIDYRMQYPYEALLDDNGKLWVADLVAGLFTNRDGSLSNSYQPNGPNTKNAFQLTYYDNKIVAVAGGYNKSYNFIGTPGEYYIFSQGQWTSYNFFSTPGFPLVNDLISSSFNPADNKLYFSTQGFGIITANPDNTYSVFDETNSTIVRAFPGTGPFGYFITDVEVDKKGNVWAANYAVQSPNEPSIHVKKMDGTWISKSFGFEEARYPIEIIIDDNDYKWIKINRSVGGIIVYNDKTNQVKYLTDKENEGKLPNISVHSMAKDKNGEIWIGTEEGIAVFYNPDEIFSGKPINAVTPIFDGFPLLFNESITCIEVDGGNRKWIGTKNGLWLLNDDGTEVISNFTVNNSPLLSNNILDLEINKITGELFISTDKGIISYRGTATEGKKQHLNVKVFPNPVKPDYKGVIGISGLAQDATVKITDIYGNLVYETQAEGGTAVWNGKNYNGEKAKTGVYLIFSASEDGEESFVSKIAVVE